MTQLSDLRTDGYTSREIIPLPNLEEFQSMFQYRLNMSARDYTFSRKFTVFINSIARDRAHVIKRYDQVELTYAGISAQRDMLETIDERGGPKKELVKELDDAWKYLDESRLDSSKAIVGSRLYERFSNGTYTMDLLLSEGMGTLKDYFTSILEPEKADGPPTSRQLAEYKILSHHFDIEEDLYFSIPLVLLGEIDGVMHYVYKAKDANRMRRHTLGSLIRIASAMYETQYLEWDLVGSNPEKTKAISASLKPDFYKDVNKNPILQEIGFERFYRDYDWYYKARVKLNDNIIHSKVYRPYLKAAITAIMIDSFAHNVSAHSLVALNWWFKQRAENLRNFKRTHQGEVAETTDIINSYIPEGFDRDRVNELIKPWKNGLFVRDVDPDYDLVNFPGPLAREIQPLLKFLMQKGAFWSGISRDNNFGGESASAFDALWGDFINNPLYLGTIAKSEDIHRLRFRVIFYEPYSAATQEGDNQWNRPKKTLLDGIFVEVDLKTRRPDILTYPNGKRGYPFSGNKEDCLCLETHPEMDELSDFVAPGKDYEKVKEALQSVRLFFPGEVVGRHAFFTLLENKIRNVKHFKGAALREMQRNGLELCISFQETPVRLDAGGEKALYSIGIWLNSPVPLRLKSSEILLKKRYNGLNKNIMDEESFAPRLGGSSQDKLCAGMLFNNFFYKVQNGDHNEMRDRSQDTERDRSFYPWIIPASSPIGDMHNDFEFRAHTEKEWKSMKKAYPHELGYMKKYFYMWKAADIHWVRNLEDANMAWENLARFKFIALSTPSLNLRETLFERIRSEGVLRIVNANLSDSLVGEEALLEAYQYWFKEWIGNESCCVRLFVDQAVVGQFEFRPTEEQSFYYFPVWELEQMNGQLSKPKSVQDLHIAHGGESENSNLLSYRSHGVYMNYFQSEIVPNEPLSLKARARMAELFEILCTRITIFDSRVYYRLGAHSYRETLSKQLLLNVYDETSQAGDSEDWLEQWESLKKSAIQDSNFLVIHLSFIERILIAKYADHPDYADENIGLFIQEEIIPFACDKNGDIRSNFILVITTGRGRTKWWTRLSEQENYKAYRRFTNFRPVESIISALEDAISRKDDIEMKYNLVKVMFGS